ncbi:hemerythrin domain-containing protein [Micromonospora sp. M51]|uniref:hemerythrin domain-containing protein n=2 Tax=Micromonosporaceae TaxID=28056 RepID=UPI0004C129BD|nr:MULTISPECIES: hemerythrin domain-containing protein [Micromonospora]MBQ1015202.1 hemerythrin domain-containing protein [Micromonospora sp. M51]MBQ1032219.1 hemerythrin domain-containing protein [Micromonospora sp. C97]
MNQNHREAMADVRDMYMAHSALRREFSLLPQLVRDVTPGDTRRAEVVGAHAEMLCHILHLHHEGEDLLLWPLLLERGGAQATAIVPTMEAQHHAIEDAHAAVVALLPQWRRTGRDGEQLADALEQLRSALIEHMALEEKEILPLAERHVTAREWMRLGEHGMSKSSKKQLPLAFGLAMYEGDPAVVKAVLAHAPLPARLLMPIIAPRLFANHARRVHGTATPPRIGATAN